MEAKNALVTETGEKYYRGLPITSMAIVLPLVFMVQSSCQITYSGFACFGADYVGILFVVDFKLKKPNNATLAVLVAVVGVAVLIMLIFTKLPDQFSRRMALVHKMGALGLHYRYGA